MKIEEEKSEEQNLSPNELSNAEMIKKMQEQIDALLSQKAAPQMGANETATAITQLVEKLKEKPDSEKYGGEDTYTRPEDIDPDDMMEEGRTFFSHQVYYVIADDKRSGHNVRTPFGKAIEFIYQSTKQVKTGNETRLHNISTYTTHSKKEEAWILEHKFYGAIFFSSHTEALSVDARKATKLAKIIIVLQRYEVHKIIKMAKDNGIPPSENIPALRISLANFLAEKEIRAEEESNRVRVKEAIIDKEVFNIESASE